MVLRRHLHSGLKSDRLGDVAFCYDLVAGFLHGRHFLRIAIMIMKMIARRLQDGSKTAPRRSKTAYQLLLCFHEAQGMPFSQLPF